MHLSRSEVAAAAQEVTLCPRRYARLMAGTQSERAAMMLQAEGMVSAQADCQVNQALELMADRAAVQGMTIEEVAQAVVDHSIRFALTRLSVGRDVEP